MPLFQEGFSSQLLYHSLQLWTKVRRKKEALQYAFDFVLFLINEQEKQGLALPTLLPLCSLLLCHLQKLHL